MIFMLVRSLKRLGFMTALFKGALPKEWV